MSISDRTPPQKILLIIAIILGIALTGCKNPNTSQTNTNNKKKILVTFSILADMAKNVAGDAAIVESLIKPGTEIHSYEPTPSDLAKAQEADLILDNGLNLEAWLEKFLGENNKSNRVALSKGIESIPIREGPYENKPNPHAWMSPKNALIYLENIRQALVNLDPANANIYNTNAQAYKEQIKAIDQKLEQKLKQLPSHHRYLVSCEGAFSYLARDYNLQEVYLWPINSEQQSTPKQIEKVINVVKAKQIPAVFCETTISNKGQLQVADETGAKYGGTLYVDSLSLPNGPVPTYLKLLEYDVETITNGLLNKKEK